MAETPGKTLKRERERQDISLYKICSFTKIKEHHLHAIEEEKYELLPPPLYVKGYLRVYARYLGLDEKQILLQYEDYLKSLLPPEPPPLPKKSPFFHNGNRPFFPSSLIILTLLFASLFIAYTVYDSSKERLTPPMPLSVLPAAAVQPEGKEQIYGWISLKETQELIGQEAEMPPTSILEILEAGLGTGIEKENDQQILTGNASEFNSNHQRGYFFTRIKTSQTGKISHVWLFEGKEYHRIEMEIKPPLWSVYSYLTFRPQHIGNWKAEARSGDQTLTSLNFKVLQ